MLVALSIIPFAAAIVFGVMAWHTRREEQRLSDARVSARSAALYGSDDDDGHRMFPEQHSLVVRRNPILTAAAGIAITVAFVVGVAMATRSGDRTSSAAGTAHATAGFASGSQLELLAMRDTRDRDTLTISCLVRNGPAGTDIDHLTVVVLAFGRDGNFLATGRALLEIAQLRPGEESPFVVTVPGVADVQRYRVTFRDAQGVVKHIDLRARA